MQDTLARAFYALPGLLPVPPLRPWLFTIAHNCASDYLRRHERKKTQPLDDADEADSAPTAEDLLAKNEAVQAAISAFTALPASQRSAVILKDVLGESLDEIATLLSTTVPAVKAALHRGRARLAARPATDDIPRQVSPTLARYAELFNARDFDGVRALLAEDVKLDLVSRTQRVGVPVGEYFTNYSRRADWHFVTGWLDGREVLAMIPGTASKPTSFVELELIDARISRIRDFHFVPYIGRDAVFVRSR